MRRFLLIIGIVILILIEYVIFLSAAGCQLNSLNNSTGSNDPVSQDSVIASAKDTKSKPAISLDAEICKQKETFQGRIVKYQNYLATLELMRSGWEPTIIQDGKAITTSIDNTKREVDKNIWWSSFYGSTSNLWKTSSLLMFFDKNNNEISKIKVESGRAKLVDGKIVVNWPTNEYMQTIVVHIYEVGNGIFPNVLKDITEQQQELDEAYEYEKQVALDNAKNGTPYQEPDKNQYVLTKNQISDIADKYITIKSVLYLK